MKIVRLSDSEYRVLIRCMYNGIENMDSLADCHRANSKNPNADAKRFSKEAGKYRKLRIKITTAHGSCAVAKVEWKILELNAKGELLSNP